MAIVAVTGPVCSLRNDDRQHAVLSECEAVFFRVSKKPRPRWKHPKRAILRGPQLNSIREGICCARGVPKE